MRWIERGDLYPLGRYGCEINPSKRYVPISTPCPYCQQPLQRPVHRVLSRVVALQDRQPAHDGIGWHVIAQDIPSDLCVVACLLCKQRFTMPMDAVNPSPREKESL